MLAAILLLGLLPFAAMPLMQDSNLSDNGTSDDEFDDDNVNDTSDSNLDDVQGTNYSVDTAPGTTSIEDFKTGTDSVEMDLTAVQGDIYFDIATTETGVAFSVTVGENVVSTVQFKGLSEVPAGDIFIIFQDGISNEALEMTLSDVLSEAADNALDPSDPDQSDVPGPVPDENTVISPTNPDDPDQPGPEVIDDSGILDPIDPDEVVPNPDDVVSLQAALLRDSDNIGGLAEVSQSVAETGAIETQLGPEDDVFVFIDNGVTETVALETVEGTANLIADAPLNIFDGGAGNDTIDTGSEAAYVFGNTGDDVLSAGDSTVALYGGAGSDLLTSNGSTDVQAYLEGGSGDDTLTGGAGDDILEGGEHGAESVSGNDLIDGGGGNDLIRGGFGSDTLIGGAGDDVIDHAGNRLEREGVTQHVFAWHIDGAADVLDGGEGDDTLILSNGDTAIGGTGDDLFWIYHDGVDGSAAEVADFQVGEDFLRISLNPQIGENDEPDVAVITSQDGLDGMVMVNGDLVAILRGAPNATTSDIYAEVTPDVFS